MRLAAAAVVAACCAAPPAAAQSTPAAGSARVEGSVLVPVGATERDVRPAAGVWVTVHRVGGGSAGPVDSARTDGSGRFGFSYARSAGDSAVFFLSASYGGVTYFSAPLPEGTVRSEDADLLVYDTTSAPVGVHLRGRHIVVGALDSTRRYPVVEVVELANDTLLTIVASDTRPTWSALLPPQAQDFRLVGGDVSPQAVTVEEGRVRLFAPMAPGVKQLSFAYSLPPGAFPLSLPVGDTLPLLEVLLEDPGATVSGAALAPTDTVAIEGRAFRRFVARDAPASGVVRISVTPPPADRRTLYVTGILTAIGLLMLLALGRSVRRPSAVPLGWNGELGPTPEALARRIAALDAAFQRRRSPTIEERQEYERLRGGLKAQLTDALVRHGDQPQG